MSPVGHLDYIHSDSIHCYRNAEYTSVHEQYVEHLVLVLNLQHSVRFVSQFKWRSK
jgi:hypothetical protein